jgi:CDP-diacylglycerol pyrophosphatase
MPRHPRQLCCLALLLLSRAPVARAADPSALWHIVHERCVPSQTTESDPHPCALVELGAGEAGGYAVLKDLNGLYQFLLIPTRRLGGIESPELLAADTPNYFQDAWAARSFLEAAAHRALPREVVGLALNSAMGRSQDQFHIHIDCLRPDVMAALHDNRDKVGADWAPFPVSLAGQSYLARRLEQPSLLQAAPPRLLAQWPAASANMGSQTLVVAGANFPAADGTLHPGFILLADHADPAIGDNASGERLQDHACAVLNGLPE